ncbi:unnamed protein product [Brassica rapa subsp. narinosa]
MYTKVDGLVRWIYLYQFKAMPVTRYLLYCSLSRFLKHFFFVI